jgi:hypothetical protein
MPDLVDRIDQMHRRQLVVDSKRAAVLGKNVHEYRAERKGTVERWTTTIWTLMNENGVADNPVEILPSIVASVEERIIRAARDEAAVAARSEIQRLLRKIAVP